MLFHMTQTRRSRAGFVLAGGKSTRMGADKAFLDFGGQSLLARALSVVGAVCDGVTIVGEPAKFAEYGIAVADLYPGCGPLAGIHAALASSGAELNLMLAVDMPCVSVELLEFLFTSAESGATVTVPRIGNGLQPLCAIYRREFAAAAEEALRARSYKIDEVFGAVTVRAIEESELMTAGFSERMFFNVNTPQERITAEEGKL